jgi:hypothetical protein
MSTQTMTDRQKYIAWCKARATEYVKAGDLANAVASMVSDMSKREDTRPPDVLLMLGVLEVQNGTAAVQRFIDGFA